MRIVTWSALDKATQADLLARPRADGGDIRAPVADILAQVRRDGDAALASLTQKLDGVAAKTLRVPPSDARRALEALPASARRAMQRACDNITKFHAAQKPQDIACDPMPGLNCALRIRPLDCVGLYVPGGSAPLFSSLMMMAIPARIAGVGRIAMASPPGADGRIAPVTLACAALCGVEEIYCMGGAQAIAAFAYGTQSVPRADKIFGPGNQWVAQAKAQVALESGGPAIDLPAGPSEVMVMADAAANPALIASDLLSQAEHDPQAQVILLCLRMDMAHNVEAAVQAQLADLPRADIARKALQSSAIIVAENTAQMLEIANLYAPEHLILQMRDADDLIASVRNAGSVFAGPLTPEALGDYASGTNHVLPTGGAARSIGGLGVRSFVKTMTVQRINADALRDLGPTVATLARMEGLEAHARAVDIRLRTIKEGQDV